MMAKKSMVKLFEGQKVKNNGNFIPVSKRRFNGFSPSTKRVRARVSLIKNTSLSPVAPLLSLLRAIVAGKKKHQNWAASHRESGRDSSNIPRTSIGILILLQSSSTCSDGRPSHGSWVALIVSGEVVVHCIVALILFSSIVMFANYQYEKATAKLGKIFGYVSMPNGL